MNTFFRAASLISASVSVLGLVMLYIHAFSSPVGAMRDTMLYVSNTMMIGGVIVYALLMFFAPRRPDVM